MLRLGVPFMGGMFSNAHIGVDFFFVLSGFIIWHVHRSDFGCPEKMPRYLLKRFFRIWPLLAVLTLLKLATFPLTRSMIASSKASPEVILCSFFMLPVPQEYGGKPVLDPAWTLSYEMLFYLVFSVGILFGKRALIACFGLWLLLTAVIATFVDSNALSHLTRFLFDGHITQFLLGCLVAEVIVRPSQLPIKAWHCGVVTAILIVAASRAEAGWLFSPDFLAKFYRGVVFAFLICGSVIFESTSRLRIPRLLVFLGDGSYSIYLAHSSVQVPAIVLAAKVASVHTMGWQLMLAAIGVISACGSLLVYQWLEKPLSKWTGLLVKRTPSRL